MKKTLSYGLKSFQIAWQANGFYSALAIFSKLYDSTLYPLTQVFLLAKLLDLLQGLKNLSNSSIYWIVIWYIVATILKQSLKSFSDVKEAFLQTQMEGYIDLQISKKLTELDPARFENPEFQNLIAQLEGIKGSLQMHLIRFTNFIDAIFKFVTATIVVSSTFPIFAPLIIVATIPSYIAWIDLELRLGHIM